VELGGDNGRNLVRLRGDRQHPSSQGYACEKAHQLDHYQNGRDRLTSPMRRRSDGTFEAIDWDTAIRQVAARLAAVRDKHGGETIFYYGGGGQGNHLPGAYATATRRVLGSRHRSSALAQEKTGEFWISNRMMGNATRADFEHCDVAMFLGKNPWQSHSIPRARVTLKELAKDPARTLIVVDPRRSETAQMADIHLAVKPGTDAWLLLALLRCLIDDNRIDHQFIAEWVADGEIANVVAALRKFEVAASCRRCGVDEALVRRTAAVIGTARAFASFEDLGVQMNRDSTLVSYLHRLLIVLTGSFGKPGSHFIPTQLVEMFGGEQKQPSPVAGARVIGGMVPCNVIAEEILCDHPKRYRAMLVEAANPAHSIADTKRMRQALLSLDTLVVIDVAMSETAQLAHYVLPSASQFEKAEATFFNFDFPRNMFHLRRRLMTPAQGTLPEAEIHARLVEALGELHEADLAPLRAAADNGLAAYAQALMTHVLPNPRLAGIAPVLLYRTMKLPDDVRQGAVLFGVLLKAAMTNAASMARAGFTGTPVAAACSLFEAVVASGSGVIFAVDDWSDVHGRIKTKDRKIHIELPDLLEELAKLGSTAESATADPQFPFVLSAGERRSFTANTIIRDPSWRKKDANGALRINPDDASALGVATGAMVRLTTRAGVIEVPIEISLMMQPGHVSLPNGLGLTYPVPGDDDNITTGVALNELTRSEDRDPFVGTPWHKRVPARIEPIG
jgi:anaerobic selenocysteine-containing dehydrogenase